MDVGGWLRSLGLGEYEERFRDSKIDADVLADLADGDLEKLGLPLGDRKRFLKAVVGLAGLATRLEPTQAKPPGSTAAQSTSAERRPITVMFCDLAGSIRLAAKLDPEDWRNLVNLYLDEASKAVTALGGHVLKKLGDGLMALFGYPQAQENDAERAVRAALAIQRALVEINAKNIGIGATENPVTPVIASPPAPAAPPRVAHEGSRIGASFFSVAPGSATALKIDSDRGLVVGAVVAGGTAAKAGIVKGDVLLSVDGTPVNSLSDLTAAVNAAASNHSAQFEMSRDGVARDVTIPL